MHHILLGIFVSLASSVLLVGAVSVKFDCNAVPQTCANMCFSMNCGHAPSMLTFDTRDKNVKSTRRNAAGCTKPNRCNSRTDGRTTCDEYPFASTSQGGGNSVTRCVSPGECRSQGGTLSIFYRGFNLSQPAATRTFGIVVVDFGNVLYCNNASNCVNDGDEFQHGVPIPRLAASLSSNASAVAGTPIGPMYITKSGVRVMSLSGELAPGDKIFGPDPTSFSVQDSCSDGQDETRKRDVGEEDVVSAEEGSGTWDEIDYLVTS